MKLRYRTSALLSILLIGMMGAFPFGRVHVLAADATPPTIQSLTSTPNPVNAGGIEVVSAHVTDAGSGVSTVYLEYIPSNGTGLTTNMNLVSGTPQDGIWQLAVSIPEAAPSGTWTIGYMGAYDVANNTTNISAPNSLLAGASFTVTGGPSADATPPVIQSLTSSPNPVNAGAIITIDAHVTDAGSGVSTVYLEYIPSNGTGLTTNMSRVSGTPQDGIWRLFVSIPSSSPSGTWTFGYMGAYDVANNTTSISAPNPVLSGAAFSVVGGSGADAIPPTIQALYSAPNPVKAGDIVVISAHVTDAGSGVSTVYLEYVPANGSGLTTNLSRISGTPQDGIWQLAVSIPASAPPGTWTIGYMGAYDEANNATNISAPNPLLAGASFTVESPVQVVPQPRPGPSLPPSNVPALPVPRSGPINVPLTTPVPLPTSR